MGQTGWKWREEGGKKITSEDGERGLKWREKETEGKRRA